MAKEEEFWGKSFEFFASAEIELILLLLNLFDVSMTWNCDSDCKSNFFSFGDGNNSRKANASRGEESKGTLFKSSSQGP